MDCYHRTVHLPKCVPFWPGLYDDVYREMRCDCRRSRQLLKELTVPYRSVNPATGEVLKTFTEHTDQQMMEALATADKAFVSWAGLPIDGRAKIISHAAQLLLERKSELAKLATLEM